MYKNSKKKKKHGPINSKHICTLLLVNLIIIKVQQVWNTSETRF